MEPTRAISPRFMARDRTTEIEQPASGSPRSTELTSYVNRRWTDNLPPPPGEFVCRFLLETEPGNMQLVACIKKTGDETKHRVVNGGIRSAPTENGNDPTDYSCRIRLNAHHPRSEIDNIDRYLVRSIGCSVYINESSLLQSGCIISSWFLVLC